MTGLVTTELAQLQLRAAEVFAQQGRLGKMRGMMQRALPALSRPGSLPQRLERFKLLIALKRYADAFAEGEGALACDRSPHTVEILKSPWNGVLFASAKGRAALSRDRQALRKLAARPETAPWALYYLSQLTPKTDAEHGACLKALGETGHAWMQREAAHYRLENYDYAGAIRAFQASARATTPASWRSHAFCAEAYLFIGRPRKALREFLVAVAAAPPQEKGDALAWMGELCLWMGRYQDALTLLEQAIPLGGLYAYCWMGAAKVKLGRPREALADFDLGLKFLPRDREAYLWRGEARRLLGDNEGALEDLSAMPLKGLAQSRWLWHDFNRGLVHGAMGNERGLRADFGAIPREVIKHVTRKIGMNPNRAPGPREMTRILAAGLRLARGYRRPENHGQAAWMGAAGRDPRTRWAPCARAHDRG